MPGSSSAPGSSTRSGTSRIAGPHAIAMAPCRRSATTGSTRSRSWATSNGQRDAARVGLNPSATGELRLAGANGEKRLHTGPGILGAEHFDERLTLEVETVGERTVETVVDHALRQTHRDDRALGELRS